MNGHGLKSSVWAPGQGYDSFRRTGDWSCSACGFSNFAWRKECFRCSPASHSDGLHTDGHLPASADYVDHSSTSSYDTHHFQAAPAQKEPGLAFSRWAPRTHRGRSKNDNIWTRTVPKTQAVSNHPQTVPTTPDLGLPYEVQHYILAMMQRILEEACYDLASRWIPQKLRENRWDCPEAVELSTWRDLLPTALPPEAIVPHASYSLERALADSVHIRNAAVHRHLCDNTELQRMVVKAQEVMSMFADATRREKFHRLWLELNDWDHSSDAAAAKEKLLLALRDISERPVDDMDWSPNIVSLEEVTNIEEGVHHGEEMDLD